MVTARRALAQPRRTPTEGGPWPTRRKIVRSAKSSLVSWNVFAPVNTAIITRTSPKSVMCTLTFDFAGTPFEDDP